MAVVRSLSRPSLTGVSVVVGFLLLICGALSGTWLFRQQRQADDWVTHTLMVEDQLSQVQIDGLKIAVDVRTAVLKDGPVDPIDMPAREREFFSNVDVLERLTIDNPVQRARIAILRTTSRRRFAILEQALAERRAGDVDAAADLITAPRFRALIDRVTKSMDDIRAEEVLLLARRSEQSQSVELRALVALIGSGVLALLLALVVLRERRQRIRALEDTQRALEDDIALRTAAEHRLDHLVANTADAIFRIGLDSTCLYASPAALEVQGYAPAAMVGHSVFIRLHADDEELLRQPFERMTRGEIDFARVTYRAANPRQIGSYIWLEASCRLIRDPGGRPLEVMASVRDVSERKALEAELEAARVRAEAASKAKAAFLANMSHEIRTPMNGVLGFTELLLANELSEQQRARAELVDSSGRAMMRLLNDILDFSKIEAGQMRLVSELFDLRHAVESCVRLVSPAAARKDLDLVCRLAPTLPKIVAGDGLRLRQILLNLLGNAVKFTEDGKVDLTVTDGSDGTMTLAVSDTGIGIPADRQQSVFDDFVQADANIAGRFGGSGLGLAITRQLVELMGGTIALESAEGAGSTFLVVLPLKPAELPASAPAAFPIVAATDRAGGRILLAEDHDINQQLYSEMLGQLGWRVDIAVNGAEAVRMVAAAANSEEPYTVVLMDMQMPVMDGAEATRRIRANGIDGSTLPILALTANAFEADLAACFAAGAQAHLTKPIAARDLDRQLRKWTSIRPAVAPQSDRRPAIEAKYQARKQRTLEALDELIRHGRFAGEHLDEIIDLLHKLAGTAGMFGEARLGDRARDLESGIRHWPVNERPERIRAGVEALRKVA